MLDANEILKAVEDLLDERYTQLQERKPGRVQAYEKPQHQSGVTQPQPPSTDRALLASGQTPTQPSRVAKPNPFGEFVVNACVLLLLTVLTERLANQ